MPGAAMRRAVGGCTGDNRMHVRTAIILSGALRAALAQAISLTDLLRPPGRLSPHPAVRAGLASDRKSGYQSGYRTWMSGKTSNEVNGIDRICC